MAHSDPFEPVVMYLVIDPDPVPPFVANRADGFAFFIGVVARNALRRENLSWGFAEAIERIERRKDDEARDYLLAMRARGVEPEVEFMVNSFTWRDLGLDEGKDTSQAKTRLYLHVACAALNPPPISTDRGKPSDGDGSIVIPGGLVEAWRNREVAEIPSDRLFYVRTGYLGMRWTSEDVQANIQRVPASGFNQTEADIVNDSGGVVLAVTPQLDPYLKNAESVIVGVYGIRGVTRENDEERSDFVIDFLPDTEEVLALRRSLVGKSLPGESLRQARDALKRFSP